MANTNATVERLLTLVTEDKRVRLALIAVGTVVGFVCLLVLGVTLSDHYGERNYFRPAQSWTVPDTAAFILGVLIGMVGLAGLLGLIRLAFLLAFLAIFAVVVFASPFPWVGWLLLGVGVGVVVARLLASRIRGRAGTRPTTFGSAEWADLDHLQRNGLIGSQGYVLGYFVKDGRPHPVHYTGDRHLLTVAPTRAGKGVSAIIPNLLTHKGSVLVIDPKGENARVTAKQRAAMGQAVHIVDPWGITGMKSSRFNPLDWLDPNDPDVAENAFMLADAMVVPSGGENAFWNEEARSLLWGTILYVALDPRFKSARHLGTVRDMLSLGNKRLFGMLNEMYQHPNRIVSAVAERTLAKEEETRANVYASVQAQTVFLDSGKMRQTLGGSDFRFEDLKEKPTTVYLVLPADRLATYGRWLRLLIQQAITCNARNLGVKPVGGRPVLFLLDEMAALGKLTKVEEAYGLMAGFGMQLWGIVQDLAQLDRIYDKGWETFIGNSGVLQYFGSRDEKTASYFSKLCGVSTVEKFSLARSISRTLGFSRSRSSSTSSSGSGGGSSLGSSYSESDSTTTGFTETADTVQRPLAFPDELMVMRKNQGLLLIENFNPIDSRKIEWFSDPNYSRLGVSIQGQQVTPHPAEPFKETPFTIPGTEEVEPVEAPAALAASTPSS